MNASFDRQIKKRQNEQTVNERGYGVAREGCLVRQQTSTCKVLKRVIHTAHKYQFSIAQLRSKLREPKTFLARPNATGAQM
jgi:hypothetical protein